MNAAELFAKLSRIANMKGEISLDEHSITWRFHEDLCLQIYMDEGEAYVDINNGMTHFHPSEEDVLNQLIAILHGEIVFVTKIGLVGRYVSGIYPIKYYEKHKAWIRLGFGTRCFTSQGIIR